MNLFKIASFLAASLITAYLAGCNRTSGKAESMGPLLPVIDLKQLEKDGCLNVEQLHNQFQGEAANSPGYQITTNFIADNVLSTTKAQYHTFSAFDLKDITTSDIGIFNQPVQNDCSTLTARTSSGEELNFNITRIMPNSIKLELVRNTNSELPSYRQEALNQKLHPFEYELQVLGSHHLRVITKYKSFDPHCRGTYLATSTLQTDYMWAGRASLLPTTVPISVAFLKTYLRSTDDMGSAPEVPPSEIPHTSDPTGVPALGTDIATTHPTLPEDPTSPPLVGSSGEFPQPVTPQFVTLADLEATSEGEYIPVTLDELRSFSKRHVRDELRRCKK